VLQLWIVTGEEFGFRPQSATVNALLCADEKLTAFVELESTIRAASI